jgi:hypothetical protein
LTEREEQIKTATLEYESVTICDQDGKPSTQYLTGVEKFKLNKAFSFEEGKNVHLENNTTVPISTYARYWNGVNSYQWNIDEGLGVVLIFLMALLRDNVFS